MASHAPYAVKLASNYKYRPAFRCRHKGKHVRNQPFALIQAYREQEALAAVPVIVLSAKEDPKLKAHSFAVGANDYVVKLPDRIELLARVRYHSSGHIRRLQRDEAFQLLRESQQRLADANIELLKLAALDGLTGIANRRRFNEVLPGDRGAKPGQFDRTTAKARRPRAVRSQIGRAQQGVPRPRLGAQTNTGSGSSVTP